MDYNAIDKKMNSNTSTSTSVVVVDDADDGMNALSPHNAEQQSQQINTDNDEIVQGKMTTLEMENKKLREEFNIQRAKMKELFIQKEGECKQLTQKLDEIKRDLNEAKSQVIVTEFQKENIIQDQGRKAQEEIASLQQLVHETIEESSHTKTEIDRLTDELEKIRFENSDLRELVLNFQHQQHESTSLSLTSSLSSNSLVPVISHVKKTLARKLGGDSSGTGGGAGGGGVNSSGSTINNNNNPDNLDDSMRKAQEDAEVLRSLVVPLEDEIKALKEKLRTTDDELQNYRGGLRTPESALVGMLNETKSNLNIENCNNDVFENDSPVNVQSQIRPQKLMTVSPSKTISKAIECSIDPLTSATILEDPCEKCEKLENDIQLEKQLNVKLTKEIDHYKVELIRESTLRTDLEKQWNEKRDLHKDEVQRLNEQIRNCEDRFHELDRKYIKYKSDIDEELQLLTTERETIHRHLDKLQNDNDFLSGRYLETSNELSNERIDLPNSVAELQELLLKYHETVIQARVSYEFEQRKSMSYCDEIRILREEVAMNNVEQRTNENQMSQKISELEHLLKEKINDCKRLVSQKDIYETEKSTLEKEASASRNLAIELRETNEKLKQSNVELREKNTTLHQDLKNSEDVQKDFVRLSQSLQMELEKIRAADTTVRWQDDDDVENCPSCKSAFAVTRRKQHCRHCGTIYCEKCLTKLVPTGQSKKPARVCDVCHTLLNRNTAPYFSQAPPQSP